MSVNNNLSVDETIICKNIEINGDLRILGEVNTIDTNVMLTERFAISNDGTGPALEVIQYGNTDIAHFYDDDKLSMIIKDGGNIGINTSNPIEKLHIEGNTYISSNLIVKNNLSIGDVIYTSNISNENSINIYGSNVNIKNKLNVTEFKTYIDNELLLSKKMYVDNELYTSNLYINGSIMKIPVGEHNIRPTVENTPTGSLFYNSE